MVFITAAECHAMSRLCHTSQSLLSWIHHITLPSSPYRLTRRRRRCRRCFHHRVRCRNNGVQDNLATNTRCKQAFLELLVSSSSKDLTPHNPLVSLDNNDLAFNKLNQLVLLVRISLVFNPSKLGFNLG